MATYSVASAFTSIYFAAFYHISHILYFLFNLNAFFIYSFKNQEIKVALGVCFALKFVERRFTLFPYVKM